MAKIKQTLECGCVVAIDYNYMIKIIYCEKHKGDPEMEQVKKAAKQAGRQEVIEFCQDNQMPDAPESSPYPGLVIISKERWEAKLKEWE